MSPAIQQGESPPVSPPTSVESVAHRHVPLWVIVAIACAAQFIVVLDTSIVNVALPAMKSGLGLSTTDQQWVIAGYLITFGGLLLFAARAGDLFGRKWVFQAGLVVFTLASLVGGLAQGPGLLVGARIVQGIGAAALAPSSLSLIMASHPEGPVRNKAMSLWAAVASSAGAVGLVLGGILTSELSWRYVFFVNVPIGVALFIAAAMSLTPSPTKADWSRLDIPGTLTVTLGASALVYGISEATTKGWGSTPVLVALGAAVVLLAAFGFIETHTSQPMVPFAIFRQRSLSVANVIMVSLGVAMTSSLFFLSLYCQQVLNYSAMRTGLALVPMTILLVTGALVTRRLIPLFGARRLLISGAVIAAGGLAWLSRLPVHSDFPAHILGPTLVLGVGLSLMVLPLTVAATTGIDARFAGLASGLINMGRQIGGAIGLSVLVTVAATVTDHSHHATPAAATVHGYSTALLICAAVILAGALSALFLPKPRTVSADGTSPREHDSRPPVDVAART